jgi:hypothetical protein
MPNSARAIVVLFTAIPFLTNPFELLESQIFASTENTPSNPNTDEIADVDAPQR